MHGDFAKSTWAKATSVCRSGKIRSRTRRIAMDFGQ